MNAQHMNELIAFITLIVSILAIGVFLLTFRSITKSVKKALVKRFVDKH